MVGSEYETTDARFTVLNNRVDLEGFSLETAPAGLDIGGWVDLEGRLRMQIGLRTQREGLSIPRLPPAVLDTLADEKGWVTIPLQVTGTLESPTVAPDVNALTSQAATGATRLLKGLFKNPLSNQ